MIGSIFPRANAETLGLMKGILRERGQDKTVMSSFIHGLYRGCWFINRQGLTSSYCVNLNSYSGLNLYNLVIKKTFRLYTKNLSVI